ncbi:MAG: hypothetical protein AAF191_06390, partial [Verrucomicrobiota bacterium]
MKEFWQVRWNELQCLWRPLPWRQGSIFHALTQYPGVWIPLLTLHAVTCWWWGRSFGLPLLFWHDEWLSALVAGTAAALTNGVIVFTFFVLDYTTWARLKDRLQGDDPGQHAQDTPHWSDRLERIFRLSLEDKKSWSLKENDSEKEKIFALEMEKQSFLFRCLTNSFAYLITALFLIRLSIYGVWELWRDQESEGSIQTVLHGDHDVWRESFQFSSFVWWMFPIGLILGGIVINWIDQAKFHFIKKMEMDTPMLPFGGKMLMWNRDTCMLLLVGWSVSLLTIAHVLIGLLSHHSIIHFAAPALCVMLCWWVLIYGLIVLLGRRPPLVTSCAVLAAIAVGALLWNVEGRYGFKTLDTLAEEGQASPLTTVRAINNENSNPQRLIQEPEEEGMIFAADRSVVAPWKDTGPLVIVCASGGGITAEVFAIEALSYCQDTLPSFSDRVRFITGASGGMVGAAAWVGSLYEGIQGMDPRSVPLKDRCKDDQLSPMALRLALYDSGLIAFFAQRWVSQLRYIDRGHLLETTWAQDTHLPELGCSLADTLPYELRGELPSLIFSPTIAEQGRPMLVSNLDVARLTQAQLPSLSKTRLDLVHPAVDGRYFLGDRRINGAPLSTWARMSATFPVVTPSGSIGFSAPWQKEGAEVDKQRAHKVHLVDAGYTDNQGTNLALNWLREY